MDFPELIGADVSRETIERLEVYVDLLTKWNPRINLVSRDSLPEVWTRHMADSAQLFPLAPHPLEHWADLGSGGGFPGLVIAILACEHGSPEKTTLVESDQRKAAFLRTVIRETGAKAVVQSERAEKIPPLGADILTARALASLSDLLHHAERHLKPGGIALFPKGERWEKELREARESWRFEHEVVRSKTEPKAVILRMEGIARV